MKDFTVLQKKIFPCGVLVALCPTMDICAVLSNSVSNSTSHVVDAYRTFSWEKNFSKSDVVGSSVSAFSFSPSGKILVVGSEDGSIAILDLESANCVTAMSEEQLPSNFSLSYNGEKSVSAIAWVQLGSSLSSDMDNYYHHIWVQGGPNLAARAGMRELDEPEDIESDSQSDGIPLPTLSSSVADTLLLTLDAQGRRLNVYACGVYLLHSIDLMERRYSLSSILSNETYIELPAVLESERAHVISSSTNPASSITICRRIFGCDRVDAINEESCLGHVYPHSGVHITFLKRMPYLETYRWHQHKTRLLLQMQKDILRIDSLLLECGKKWRDAAKVIPMKLSLLASTLKGYEMEYTPVEFFYTIALFGQWHPAAQSSFASHWNEQGLQRLRSSITSASKDIEKRLHMNVIPVLTNFLLSCRELMGIEEAEIDLITNHSTFSLQEGLCNKMKDRRDELSHLINNSEWLMYKVDETIHECKYAGRNMLLFLQFLKENMILASNEEASDNDLSSLQQVSPSEYLVLFDPRIPRAPEGLLGPKAQAECATGTHLYAYFSESPLPLDVVEYRKPFNGFYSTVKAEDLPGSKHVESVQEILRIAEERSGFDSETFAKTSLLSQFKTTSALFGNVLQHGQHLPDWQYTPSKNCSPEQSSSKCDSNIIFIFQQNRPERVLAEDIVHMSNISIFTNIDLRDNTSDEAFEQDQDSDDDSISKGDVFIDSGHIFAFAISSLEFLLLWRSEESEVCWYSSLIRLSVPTKEHEQMDLTFIKLYACTASESQAGRVALVGCLSDSINNIHLLFKVDLLDESMNYRNVTNKVVADSNSIDNAVVIGERVLECFECPKVIEPKLREFHCRGTLVDIRPCASRGLLGLLLADEVENYGVARQIIILDLEEDEEDDSSSDNGGENEDDDDSSDGDVEP